MFEKVRRHLRMRESVGQGVSVGMAFSVGKGSRLWAPKSLTIGNDVSVGSGVRVEVDGSIGDGVLLANGSAIVGRTDHHMYEVGRTIRRATWVGTAPDELSLPTHVGSDVWIGFGAIVLSGVRIGDSAIVGAGAIVTKDVEPNTIVAGVPARTVGKRFSDEDFVEHWTRLRAAGVRSSD